MKKMDLEYWKRVIERLNETFKEREGKLCSYDGAIGDGDHGTSMVFGFSEAMKALAGMPVSDVGDLFCTVGNAFINSVGGVTGIIFGTMFLNAGRNAAGKSELTTEDLHGILFESLNAVMKAGNVTEGQKSMVDAFAPAVRALGNAVQGGATAASALALAHRAAGEGMEATSNMKAGVGRGRYQADKGIGHIDAGAASVELIFDVFSAEYSRE